MCVHRHIYINKRMWWGREGEKEGGRDGGRERCRQAGRKGWTGMIPTWSALLYFLPIPFQSSLHSKASPSSSWNFMESVSNLINYMSRGVMWVIFQLLLKRKGSTLGFTLLWQQQPLSFSHTDKERAPGAERGGTKDLPGQTRLATLLQDRSQWLSDQTWVYGI